MLFLIRAGPKCGYQKCPHFWAPVGTPGNPEVAAFFTWGQWLATVVVPLADTVVVNLDETAMARHVSGVRGNVLHMTHGHAADALLYERGGTRDTHAHTTLVATICNDPALQARLPQFLLPRDASLSRAEQRALGGVVPPL